MNLQANGQRVVFVILAMATSVLASLYLSVRIGAQSLPNPLPDKGRIRMTLTTAVVFHSPDASQGSGTVEWTELVQFNERGAEVTRIMSDVGTGSASFSSVDYDNSGREAQDRLETFLPPDRQTINRTYTYSDDGKRVEIQEKDSSGKCFGKRIRKQNSARESVLVAYNMKGEVTSTEVRRTNLDGAIIEEVHKRPGHGDTDHRIEYAYNERGDLAESRTFLSSSQQPISIYRNIFRPDGKLDESRDIGRDGSVRDSTKYEYSQTGCITTLIYHDNALVSKSVYECDSRGNWIRQLVFSCQQRGDAITYMLDEIRYRTILYWDSPARR